MSVAVPERSVGHFSLADVLWSPPVLDSDESEDGEESPATRIWALTEEGWDAAIQELCEKRPHIFDAHTSVKHRPKSSGELCEKRPLSGSDEPLTHPRRPRPVKARSWNVNSKKDQPHQDDQLSPANLLNSCPVLQSDDSEDERSSDPSKRAHVLMEKEFTAGVQELREKRPQLFLPVGSKYLRKSVRFSIHPRKHPGNRRSSSDATASMQQFPRQSVKNGDGAGGNGSTDFISLEDLNSPSSHSESESVMEAMGG